MSSLPIWPQNSFIHKDYKKDQLGFYMDQKELTIDSKGLKMVFRSKISVFWLTWEVPPSLPMETLAKNLCLILGYPRPPPHVRTKSDSKASLIYLKNMLTVIPFSSQLPPSHHHLQCSGWRVPRALSLPPIPPNFQYPPHPCIHTCPTTPPPILKHGNVFIGNRIFPSMPCFPALALAAFNTKLVFGCQRPLGRCHQLSKHLSEILQTIFGHIASNMSVEMIFWPRIKAGINTSTKWRVVSAWLHWDKGRPARLDPHVN